MKRKKRIDPEVRAELEASYRRTVRLLEERIAYHQAKLEAQPTKPS